MKRNWIKALRAVLAVALAAGLSVILWRQVEYASGNADYKKAEGLAGVSIQQLPQPAPSSPESARPSPDPAPASGAPEDTDPNLALLGSIDLAALQAVNPDVVGWIAIPGTELSYPLLQGEDNQYYLNHTWQGHRSSVGAIYLDFRADPSLMYFHTLIYGHRMHNGSMFGSLAGYDDAEYWRAHPSVYIVHGDGVNRYDIFAAFKAHVNSSVYQLDSPGNAERGEFLDWCLEQSVIRTNITPAAGDRVITLSTCVSLGRSDYRWVVQAVLAAPDPNA